jgi:catechol-2,3-dioxygenase
MPVRGFDHYNLRASRPVLEELKAFYCEVVGLTVGARPPYRTVEVPLLDMDQLFLHDPAGNGIELQFASAERP